MPTTAPEWHEPRSLEEALALRAELGDDATVVAGGSFLGIVINQKLLAPPRLVALRRVPDLGYIEAGDGLLRLGAMATHRSVEQHGGVQGGWPALAFTFSVVASPGSGTRRPSAGSWPTPTTPRTPPRCWSHSGRASWRGACAGSARSQWMSSSSGTTRPHSRRTSSSRSFASRTVRGLRSTGSSGAAPARTDRASRSQLRGTTGTSRS